MPTRTLATKARRDHQAERGAAALDAQPAQDGSRALTASETGRLVPRVMIVEARLDFDPAPPPNGGGRIPQKQIKWSECHSEVASFHV